MRAKIRSGWEMTSVEDGAKALLGQLAARPAPAYALMLLTLVSFFNYMDRMVLAVVLQPIKLDLHLTDGQLGLLAGFAFAVLYATLGVPLGRMADHRPRVLLLSACLAIWSVMTAATGLARNFVQLFFVRMGVGVGEAGCVPAAHSLLGDLFPEERRAFAISVFQAGGIAGLSGGLVLAGVFAQAFGWRVAVAMVGAPGLLLAAVVALTLREPMRPGRTSATQSERMLFAVRALLRRPALRHLLVALSIGSFGTYGLAQWLPSFYIRSYHLTLAEVGLRAGLAGGVGGVLGVLCGGFVAAHLQARDRRWELWWPALTYGGSAPLYLAVFFAPSAWAAIALQILATFLAAAGGGVALSAIQSFAEHDRRATAIALVLFLSSLLGLGAGPYAIGLLSDLLHPRFGDESLRYALVLSTAALVWAGAHFAWAARTARADRI